jgi:hypothetical protein
MLVLDERIDISSAVNFDSILEQVLMLCRLLDSPGLVLASGSRTDASVALRNAVKVSNALQKYLCPGKTLCYEADLCSMYQELLIPFRLNFKLRIFYFSQTVTVLSNFASQLLQDLWN